MVNMTTGRVPPDGSTIKINSAGQLQAESLNITGLTEGDVLYFDGSALARLAIGSSGQGLKVNSGATAPEWGAVGTLVEVGQADMNGSSVTIDNISETYDLYILKFSLAYSSGGTSGSDYLQLFLNNDSSASYDYSYLSSTANAQQLNGTGFSIGNVLDTNTNFTGSILIGVQNGTAKYPSVNGIVGGGDPSFLFFGGMLDTTATQLTKIELKVASRTYVGHVKLYGVDIT